MKIFLNELDHDYDFSQHIVGRFKMFFIRIFGKKIEIWHGSVKAVSYKFRGKFYLDII